MTALIGMTRSIMFGIQGTGRQRGEPKVRCIMSEVQPRVLGLAAFAQRGDSFCPVGELGECACTADARV